MTFPAEISLSRLTLTWSVVLAFLSALCVGGLAAVNTQLALVAAIAILMLMAVILRPASILLLLAASIFLELINIGGLTISRLIAPIALFVIILTALRGDARLRPAAPLYWAIAYSVWALASGFWTVSVAGTVYLLASLAIALVYMLAFAMLLRTRDDLRLVLYVLTVVSVLIGVLSIAAFIGRPILGFGLLQEGRVQGGTGDPSFFAAAQLIALPLMLVLAAEIERTSLRLLVYAAALVNIASVFSTVSRGGLIQLVVILLLFLAWPARTLFRSPRQKTAAMVAILLGAGVFFVHYSADLVPRFKTIFLPGSEQTGSGREWFWLAARKSIDERPVLGLGYGAFVRVSNDLIRDTPGVNLTRFKLRPHGSEVHNAFLGTLTELGVVGLALFGGLLISTALALRRAARKARAVGDEFIGRVASALVIGLLGWCVGSLFIETETSRPIWILIGISLALPAIIEGRTSAAAGNRSAVRAAPRA
jgi:O-antigen ligase